MQRFFSFWRNLLRRHRVERDLDDEMRATLEILGEEKLRAGMTAQEARRQAAIELGTVESLKQQVREARAGALIDTLLQDLRYGVRLLLRNPLFSLTASLSLAIGIGATTAIFTVANGLLLRTTAGVGDPDTLVDIVRTRSDRGVEPGLDPISYPDYLDVRSRVTTLEHVYAYALELDEAGLRAGDSAERIFANVVSTNYFTALRVPTAAGRLFDSRDSEEPGASPLVVLSHRYWATRFGADPTVIGSTIRLNGVPVTVIGAAGEAFRGTSVVAPDLWAPLSMIGVLQPEGGIERLTNRFGSSLMVGGRLKPGVARAQAAAELRALGDALGREHPMPAFVGAPPEVLNATFTWSAEQPSPIPFGLRFAVAGFVTFLMTLVSLLLVIACANVAGILLARATVRRREIAVRTAIGAGRLRIVRQMVTETVVLFAVGGLAGLLFARVVTSLIVRLLPAFPVPVNVSMPLDVRVVAFSMGLSLVAAILAGLAPAMNASRTDVVSGLKPDESVPHERLRLRNAFVVAQVAFSVLLIVTAAVLARGLRSVTVVDRGFDAHGVDVATMTLSMAGYTPATGPAFARELLARARQLPGVESATLADRVPGGPGMMMAGGVSIPGVVPPGGARDFIPNWILVGPTYFATLRMPITAGRDFDDGDREGAERVAVIDESGARRLWPGRDPVGQVVHVTATSVVSGATPEQTSYRIIGVVRDRGTPRDSGSREIGGPRREASFNFYVPWHQHYRAQLALFIRRAGEQSRASELRTLIAAANPNLAVLTAQSLEQQQAGPVETQLRVAAAVAGSVGLVGLLLATLGIYGVTAYAVTRRTREIGIRLSLGAAGSDVVGLVLRQGMSLVMLGVVIGLALGAAVGRAMSVSPLSVQPPSAAVFGGATALFLTVGLIACYVPVRRATRIHATEALRAE